MLVSFFQKIGQPVRWLQRRKRPLMQEGNRPNDGPPDLDQLWRDFNKRLNTWLGTGNRGNGPNPSGNNDGSNNIKGAGIGAGVIVAVIAFFWLISGFFIVQEGQTAVVMTFGKYSHATHAGFNWRGPYPFQSHEIVNVSQVRTVEVGYRSTAKNKKPQEALMLTEDENIVDIQFAVQYKIKNAADWIFNNRDQDEVMVRQVAETAVREIVGRAKMDFVVYEGREKVALDVNQSMQTILDRYKSGVQVTNITMQDVQPPEQVQAAFNDAVKAGQDKQRQINEGQAYANDVLPKADGAAARLLAEAEGYSSRVVENASGDASRFKQVVAEYQKAPQVTRDRMYLETMQTVFNNASKVMIDAKSGNNLLSLPLDKLIAQTAANESAKAAAAPQQVVVTPQSTNDNYSDAARQREMRSRDGRDREGR